MWKRIEDEMPPMDQSVLCYGIDTLSNKPAMAVLYWDLAGGGTYWNAACVSGYEWDLDLRPTHWMPLPDAPV